MREGERAREGERDKTERKTIRGNERYREKARENLRKAVKREALRLCGKEIDLQAKGDERALTWKEQISSRIPNEDECRRCSSP